MAQRTDVRSWEMTFDGVVDPLAMKFKLEQCLFFKKCNDPKSVKVDGAKVVLSFAAALSRQDVMKKCTQTFRAYGSFTSHAVADKGALAVSTGSLVRSFLGALRLAHALTTSSPHWAYLSLTLFLPFFFATALFRQFSFYTASVC